MPTVTVKLFGPARDAVGAASVTLQIETGDTVGRLAGRLAELYPRLGESLGVRLAVNRAYVALSHILQDGDEVAVIPPVSGGSPPPTVALVRGPIDLAAIAASMARPEAGAVVTFIGTVREDRQDDRTLVALEYHAYEEMALEQILSIRALALQRFGILDAAVVHRLGRVDLGDASVAIVVASAHRAAGFDACRWIIDAIKTDAPLWKKDIWSDGSQTWVDPGAGSEEAGTCG